MTIIAVIYNPFIVGRDYIHRISFNDRIEIRSCFIETKNSNFEVDTHLLYQTYKRAKYGAFDKAEQKKYAEISKNVITVVAKTVVIDTDRLESSHIDSGLVEPKMHPINDNAHENNYLSDEKADFMIDIEMLKSKKKKSNSNFKVNKGFLKLKKNNYNGYKNVFEPATIMSSNEFDTITTGVENNIKSGTQIPEPLDDNDESSNPPEQKAKTIEDFDWYDDEVSTKKDIF